MTGKWYDLDKAAEIRAFRTITGNGAELNVFNGYRI
jgi:hypothetical protein